MRSPLARFLLLYAALYAAFGVQSPYLPSLLQDHGLGPEQVGLLLACGTGIRLLAGPAAGHIADWLDCPRLVLAACAALAAAAGLCYGAASGLLPLLLVVLLQGAALAPLAPLSDRVALGSAGDRGSAGFDYGWVRGAGSAAFIAGSLLGGFAIAESGTGVIIWLNALLLAATAAAAAITAPVPVRAQQDQSDKPGLQGIGTLLRLAPFRRLLLVSALILGSHALHDGFAVIRWRAAGIGADTAGLLWSESVAAEVVVFLLIGPRLLARIGVAGAALLAGGAAVLRWGVMAETAAVPAMMLIEPLHGFSFALLHLAAMRLMAEMLPERLAATALAFYGTVAIGAATALLTLASGPLYAALGPRAFWVMAVLAGLALPLAARLGRDDSPRFADRRAAR